MQIAGQSTKNSALDRYHGRVNQSASPFNENSVSLILPSIVRSCSSGLASVGASPLSGSRSRSSRRQLSQSVRPLGRPASPIADLAFLPDNSQVRTYRIAGSQFPGEAVPECRRSIQAACRADSTLSWRGVGRFSHSLGRFCNSSAERSPMGSRSSSKLDFTTGTAGNDCKIFFLNDLDVVLRESWPRASLPSGRRYPRS